jgi:peptidylprolyl isomerase
MSLCAVGCRQQRQEYIRLVNKQAVYNVRSVVRELHKMNTKMYKRVPCLFGLLLSFGITTEATLAAPNSAKKENIKMAQAQEVTTPSGLKYTDEVIGNGPSPRNGQTVSVHYTGWLTNGTKFDSSLDRGQPFSFTLGQGQVIKGWDEGVASMKIGGKRKLTIPPDLGYGSRGAGGVIPGNATLVFEVQLLGVQ